MSLTNAAKKELLILFGGASPEYQVSCLSASSLVEAVPEERYNVHLLGITRQGDWLLTDATASEIADGRTWLCRENNRRAILSPDRRDHGLVVFENGVWTHIRIDLAFAIIHGETGEDGALQGLLELSGIPYVGAGICASACSMDKSVTMAFADQCHIRRPEYFVCDRLDFLEQPEVVTAQIEMYFGERLGQPFPLFVKPASAGSSIGISKVHTPEELRSALQLAAQYPGRLIVEENITGREIKVAVLGHRKLKLGAICEIKVENGVFNDYELKYKGTGTHKRIPAQLPEKIDAELKQSAAAIYKKLGCRGFARVDFFLKDNGDIYFNEINTVPGFSNHSIYSLMFEKAGIDYGVLVEELLESAVGEK